MSTSKVTVRREAKIASIVATAWELAEADGVAGLSLHALARAVGLRQPSLYEYFDSKHALYDEMFADGNRQLQAHLAALTLPREPRRALKRYLGALASFALERPARYELMFLRHLPNFTPSDASYAIAGEVLGTFVERMTAAGVTKPDDVDCLVAMTAGLIDAQLANEPNTDRWIRHLDRLIDLLVDDAIRRSAQ
ncbi:MAG: TetR/AcrR family transcriptional regulator [Acidimicrobiales bacterium]|nr:TetR/AcrR family transcriptional regulator [Acidimicrobiales bacterium]